MKIKNITSRKILNSAAKWTVETQIVLEDDSTGIASIPGGLSKGENETTTLSADEALKNIEDLKPQLYKNDFDSINLLDEFLLAKDGTDDKSVLGGNTILSLSIAFTKALAASKGMQTYEYIDYVLNDGNPKKGYKIPQMMMLMMEGGLHGSGAATIQEFMAIVPSLARGVDIYNAIREELHKLGKSTNVGAEGAFSPEHFDNDQILTLLSGYLHGEKIALDVAASSFTESQPLPNYDNLLKNYPIYSIEDPYSENDWSSWEVFAQKHHDKLASGELMIVTDDLTTTNPKLLKKALDKQVGNAILVKPNQIGTVSETLEVIKMAQDNIWRVVISHRGTDTNDDFIADLAIGSHADYTKFGAPARGERVAKYNRLAAI